MMRIETDSNALAYMYRDGVAGLACRCGELHSGDYAIEKMLQHECLHDGNLIQLFDDHVVCPLCGASWQTERMAL